MALMDDINKFNDFLTKYKNKEIDKMPEDYSDTDDFKLDDFINDAANWQEDVSTGNEMAPDESDYLPDNEDTSWIDTLFADEDVNGDGDTDVEYSDTDDNGDIDTAKVTADTPEEAAEGLDKATSSLADDEETTTGKSKNDVERDDTQKNVATALKDLNF
jgi:hypothetical protein